MKVFIVLLLQILVLATAVSAQSENTAEYWRQNAQAFLRSKLNEKYKTKKAKNIIMFLGDGMSLSTVSAVRAYLGNEGISTVFDRFPYFGFSKTYCLNGQTADSSCTATAYLNSVKANMLTTGVTANVQAEQCVITEKDKTESIASWAQKAGKATGLVTTTTVTHASPSGAYANTPSRFWEGNKALDLMCGSNTNVRDIAYQLINGEVGKKFKVILGGGRAHMINSTMMDEEGQFGQRTDGRNLINEWLAAKNQQNVGQFVWHKQQLDEVNYNNVDYLLGLFESLDCLYQMDINDGNLHNQEPTLTDMTVAAIRMLEKDPNGYFLFVESGKIDHAHHYNQANRAMVETEEFIRAIETARGMTNDDDTLIVITSDHSHTFTYSGYGPRKSDILGFGGISDMDQKPYLKLSYANGPAYDTTYIKNTAERVDLTNVGILNHAFLQSATVPLSAETHAGDDVGIFASGPFEHLFAGSYEQNNIPMLMAYAAQIGPFAKK